MYSRKDKVTNSPSPDTETKRMLFNHKDETRDGDSSVSPSVSTLSVKRRSSLIQTTENVRTSIRWKENSANFEDFYKKRGEYLTNYLHAICKEPSKSLMKDTVNSSYRSVSMIDINLLKEKKEIRRLSILANKEKYLHEEEKRQTQQSALHSDNWNSSNFISKRRSSMLGKSRDHSKSPVSLRIIIFTFIYSLFFCFSYYFYYFYYYTYYFFFYFYYYFFYFYFYIYLLFFAYI